MNKFFDRISMQARILSLEQLNFQRIELFGLRFFSGSFTKHQSALYCKHIQRDVVYFV